MVINSSVQQNLLQSTTGADPFAQAQSKSFSMAQPQGGMENPFPDMNIGISPGAPQPPTLNQTLPQNMSFKDLAGQHQIDVSGLNKNENIGRLQLMDRLGKKFGPDYMQRPEAQALLKAHATQNFDSSKSVERDLLSTKAKGERTLKALLGGV